MIRRRAYDVSELGMTYFLRTFDEEGRTPFLAIPVFPVRAFRHGAIYINKNSGIEEPENLIGKRIGELGLYGHDAGVIPKGILSDDFGVKPEQATGSSAASISRWVPLISCLTLCQPAWKSNGSALTNVDLGAMLERGEIDALISADAPKAILEGSPKVGRLFEDYEAVERDYYRRTGIFPIIHTVAVTRELAEEHPDLVKAVYHGFCTAKDRMQEQYVKGMTFNNMAIMLPWFSKLIEEDRALLGDDWWPYGVQRNRSAIDVVLRYHHEQGLTKRRLAIEDVFFPGLLNT
jgi:4,5-dihydroxyphthalate decarboxylase